MSMKKTPLALFWSPATEVAKLPASSQNRLLLPVGNVKGITLDRNSEWSKIKLVIKWRPVEARIKYYLNKFNFLYVKK